MFTDFFRVKLANIGFCAIFLLLGTLMEFPERITIQSHTIPIIPRYVETDKGGVVHHSVFAVWFELGRTELLRVNNVAYKDLEAAEVCFVVAELKTKFRRPANYDEKLELTTSCSNVTASKIEHTYLLKRACDGVIIAEGSSILACISDERKVRRIPKFMYPDS